MVEVLHLTRRKNQGKSLGKHLELSERWRAFAQEAGDEEGRPHETQGRQGEVSPGQAHVRHVQRLHISGRRS